MNPPKIDFSFFEKNMQESRDLGSEDKEMLNMAIKMNQFELIQELFPKVCEKDMKYVVQKMYKYSSPEILRYFLRRIKKTYIPKKRVSLKTLDIILSTGHYSDIIHIKSVDEFLLLLRHRPDDEENIGRIITYRYLNGHITWDEYKIFLDEYYTDKHLVWFLEKGIEYVNFNMIKYVVAKNNYIKIGPAIRISSDFIYKCPEYILKKISWAFRDADNYAIRAIIQRGYNVYKILEHIISDKYYGLWCALLCGKQEIIDDIIQKGMIVPDNDLMINSIVTYNETILNYCLEKLPEIDIYNIIKYHIYRNLDSMKYILKRRKISFDDISFARFIGHSEEMFDLALRNGLKMGDQRISSNNSGLIYLRTAHKKMECIIWNWNLSEKQNRLALSLGCVDNDLKRCIRNISYIINPLCFVGKDERLMKLILYRNDFGKRMLKCYMYDVIIY